MSGFSGTESVERTGNSHEFLAACAGRLPLRLTVRNERNGATDDVLLERPWALVGGDEHCDLRLLHPDVSQRHAYLQFVGSRLLCCDLGSRTGTHWSTEIRSRSWLKAEEPIFIGPYSIRLHDNEFAEGGILADPSAAPPKPELPKVTLAFVNARSRAGRSKKSRIRRPVTLIGWSHLSNLRLQHSSVGRVHASLVWTPVGLWVVDLLCRGGTRVNGEPVDVARLLEGDEITLGRFQLRVSYGDPQEHDAEPANGDSVESAGNGFVPARIAAAPTDQVAINGNGHASNGSLAPRPPAGMPVPLQPTAVQLLGRASEISALRSSSPSLPEGASADSVALVLMQQFSTMQQQMFDHTQQLLSMMAQTFNAAHTRQLDLIRSELMRVHEVNRELQELKLELTFSRGASAMPPASPAPPAAPVPSPTARPMPALGSAPGSAPGPAATKDTVPEQPTFSGEATAAPGQKEPPAHAPQRKAKRPRTAPPSDKEQSDKEQSENGQSANGHVEAGADKAGADMHGWLSGRINELEEERTSRWQKILQLLAPTAGQS